RTHLPPPCRSGTRRKSYVPPARYPAPPARTLHARWREASSLHRRTPGNCKTGYPSSGPRDIPSFFFISVCDLAKRELDPTLRLLVIKRLTATVNKAIW